MIVRGPQGNSQILNMKLQMAQDEPLKTGAQVLRQFFFNDKPGSILI